MHRTTCTEEFKEEAIKQIIERDHGIVELLGVANVPIYWNRSCIVGAVGWLPIIKEAIQR